MIKTIKISIILISFLFISSCGIYKYTDQRGQPSSGLEKARKNIEEGKGAGLKGLIRNNRNSEYEFSTSNSLWRASLEILDFLPLSTVDYSGGVIITDWYSSNNQFKDEIKITIRFLNNTIESSSLKIITHQRNCNKVNECSVKEVKSKIHEELSKSVLQRASILESEKKLKK